MATWRRRVLQCCTEDALGCERLPRPRLMSPRVCAQHHSCLMCFQDSCFRLSTKYGIKSPTCFLSFHPIFCMPHRERGLAMTFEEMLDQAVAMLQRRGRIT